MSNSPIQRTSASSQAGNRFRYYDFVMAAFVTVLLLSNVIGAAKPTFIMINGEQRIYGAGILFFPLGYVIGDVLTEVYGYARARRVIWAGFAALLFMAFMSWVVVSLPPAEGWEGQAAYESVFGQVPRIVAASIVAFWAGEFMNSYVMARMKVWTQGKALWSHLSLARSRPRPACRLFRSCARRGKVRLQKPGSGSALSIRRRSAR